MSSWLQSNEWSMWRPTGLNTQRIYAPDGLGPPTSGLIPRAAFLDMSSYYLIVDELLINTRFIFIKEVNY